jgi:hypothetical protein
VVFQRQRQEHLQHRGNDRGPLHLQLLDHLQQRAGIEPALQRRNAWFFRVPAGDRDEDPKRVGER